MWKNSLGFLLCGHKHLIFSVFERFMILEFIQMCHLKFVSQCKCERPLISSQKQPATVGSCRLWFVQAFCLSLSWQQSLSLSVVFTFMVTTKTNSGSVGSWDLFGSLLSRHQCRWKSIRPAPAEMLTDEVVFKFIHITFSHVGLRPSSLSDRR